MMTKLVENPPPNATCGKYKVFANSDAGRSITDDNKNHFNFISPPVAIGLDPSDLRKPEHLRQFMNTQHVRFDSYSGSNENFVLAAASVINHKDLARPVVATKVEDSAGRAF